VEERRRTHRLLRDVCMRKRTTACGSSAVTRFGCAPGLKAVRMPLGCHRLQQPVSSSNGDQDSMLRRPHCTSPPPNALSRNARTHMPPGKGITERGGLGHCQRTIACRCGVMCDPIQHV
jgi:hypothetical protein